MRYIISKPLSIHELGQRTNQEDSFYPSIGSLSDNQRFFILCDGMGGHESGEVASSTVCECMGDYLYDKLSEGKSFSNQLFENALEYAYEGLDSKDNPDSVKKMGTTMTFLMFHDSGVTAAHIGDSRIYQFRPGVSGPIFKTRDHSLVNDLILLGELTEEEARTSMNKNVITRAMQPGQENRSKADMTLLTDVKPGDWFYMCSDGMLEEMDDEVLGGILTDQSMTEDEKRDLLIRRTSSNKDNHTALIIHMLDVIKESVNVAEPGQEQLGSMDISGTAFNTSKKTISLSKHAIAKLLYAVMAILVCAVLFFCIIKPRIGSENTQSTEPDKPVKTNVTQPSKKPKKDSLGSKTIALTSISLENSSLTLDEGGSSKLIIIFTPSDATDKKTTWKSSDPGVATVDNNGNVKAAKAGTTTIIASCGGFEARCEVRVASKAGPNYFSPQPLVNDTNNAKLNLSE